MKVSLWVDLRKPHDGTGSLAESQKMDRVLWKLYVFCYLVQGVLILALLWHFGMDNSLLGWGILYIAGCLENIPGPYQLDAGGNPFHHQKGLIITNVNNVSRHCQCPWGMGGKIALVEYHLFSTWRVVVHN